MRRPYRLLGVGVLAAAAFLAISSRPPERASTPVPVAPPRLERAAAIVIAASGVSPARTVVPKGALVTLTAENRDARPRRLALLGYEGRFTPATIAPGRSVVVRFVADRPGSDFAWLVDGHPAGGFAVTGSHLVEGHR